MGGSAPSPTPTPVGYDYIPLICEPRRRVVVLIVLPTCEILRDFTRFCKCLQYASLTGESWQGFETLHEVNHYENDRTKQCCKCYSMNTVEFSQ